MSVLKLGRRTVGLGYPTYFIADIAANHDGDLERAKLLIRLCADAGADAAKFQNFRASKIVSDRGFQKLGAQVSHQSKWKKSVFDTYKDATVPWEWTPILQQECEACGIDYFSTPYDLEAVDMLHPYVKLYKIGSGDITWTEMLQKVASTGKPVLLATGASTLSEVEGAVKTILDINPQLAVMQCNTNYTGNRDNLRHIHLNVLDTYSKKFPGTVLGLSDHTPGNVTVLGAVALGARVIEKHFTDDNRREGPDHPFSMTSATWREMVDRTRDLELALGSSVKEVEANEEETVVVQRRCLRAAEDLAAGVVLTPEMLEALRPAPRDGIAPCHLSKIVGKRLVHAIQSGDYLTWNDLT